MPDFFKNFWVDKTRPGAEHFRRAEQALVDLVSIGNARALRHTSSSRGMGRDFTLSRWDFGLA
jgi:hypothetical protein